MPKDIEDRIRATEQKFRVLFDNKHDDIWVLDVSSMKFVYASTASEGIDGRTPEETIGQPLHQMVTPEFVRVAMERLESEITRFKTGEHRTVRMEAELIAKDGSVIKTSVDMRLFEDEGGLRVLGITRDPFTNKEIKRAETQLEAQLQEVLAERDRLRWEVKILQGLLPICSNCRKIRDEDGNWVGLEEYVQSHSEADFTHTICPPCREELYPGL